MCVLDEEKECDGCLECEICDLDPNKICDNCGKCLDIKEYAPSASINCIRIPRNMSGMSIKKERVERNFDREFIIIEKYGARYLASKIVRLFILFFNDLFHNYDK